MSHIIKVVDTIFCVPGSFGDPVTTEVRSMAQKKTKSLFTTSCHGQMKPQCKASDVPNGQCKQYSFSRYMLEVVYDFTKEQIVNRSMFLGSVKC